MHPVRRLGRGVKSLVRAALARCASLVTRRALAASPRRRMRAVEEGLRRDLLLLALAASLLFLPGLGRRDVWNPDEARYAEVAREMRDAGSWALPRLNGEIYTQKPPLTFWMIDAASVLTGGVDET